MTSLKDMILDYRNHIHAHDTITGRAVRITGEFSDALDGEFTNFAREMVALRGRVTELEQQKPAVTMEEDRRQGPRDTMLKFMSGDFYKEIAPAVRPTPSAVMSEREKAATYDRVCKGYGVTEGSLVTFVFTTKRRADDMEERLCQKQGELNDARAVARESAEVCKEFSIAPGNLMQAFRNLKAKCERLTVEDSTLTRKVRGYKNCCSVAGVPEGELYAWIENAKRELKERSVRNERLTLINSGLNTELGVVRTKFAIAHHTLVRIADRQISHPANYCEEALRGIGGVK